MGILALLRHAPWSYLFSLFDALGFPGGSVVKRPPASAGGTGSVPGSGRPPWRWKWQPPPVFLSGKSRGWRSLVGYSTGSQESWTQLSD